MHVCKVNGGEEVEIGDVTGCFTEVSWGPFIQSAPPGPLAQLSTLALCTLQCAGALAVRVPVNPRQSATAPQSDYALILVS